MLKPVATGAPACSVKGDAADVVHVAVCDKHVLMAHGAVGAPANVKCHLDFRQQDACLLRAAHCIERATQLANIAPNAVMCVSPRVQQQERASVKCADTC